MVETIHGILRRLTLVPWIGEARANQVGVLVGSALICVIAWATIRWIGAKAKAELWAIGGLWTGLMICFEFGIGAALNVAPERMLADYDLSKGGLMAFGMLFLLASPVLAARVRGIQ
jgi:hypothetical protein